MRKLLRNEWKRYLLAFLLMTFVMIVYFAIIDMSNALSIARDGDAYYYLWDSTLNDIISIFSYTYENIYVIGIMYLIFRVVDTVVKRKKGYHEFVKTLPVKSWKRRLFYYLADVCLLCFSCIVVWMVKLICFNSWTAMHEISADWVPRLCLYTVIEEGITIVFLLSLFHLIESVVVSHVWKIPVAVIVIGILGLIPLAISESDNPTSNKLADFYYELTNFENTPLYHVYDGTLYDIVNGLDETIPNTIFGEQYEATITEWTNKMFVSEWDEERSVAIVDVAKLPPNELYKGEIHPKLNLTYKGEILSKAFENRISSNNSDEIEFRYDSEMVLLTDVNLCILEQYLDNYIWTYHLLRLGIAVLFVLLTCLLSGKCYGQKKMFYFAGVKYIFASIVGLFAFVFFVYSLEVSIVESVIFAIVVAGVTVWFMIPNRKQLLAKK